MQAGPLWTRNQSELPGVCYAQGSIPSPADTAQSYIEGKSFQFLQLNTQKRKGIIKNVMSDKILNWIGGRGNHNGHRLRDGSWKNRYYIRVGRTVRYAMYTNCLLRSEVHMHLQKISAVDYWIRDRDALCLHLFHVMDDLDPCAVSR